MSPTAEALNLLDWNVLLSRGTGTLFAVIIGGEPAVGKVLETESKPGREYDRKFWVVVEVDGLYFKREGHETNSSYCYGDGDETYWGEIFQVHARQVSGVVYEPLD